MSYLVLARKYRPRNFSEMVGQEHVVQALSNALGQQRLHHAYLFTGTRGVGKTTVARILAKSLNCTGADGAGGITATPCGQCASCTQIDAGRFVDYTELDAASNRGVDEVQGLLEQAVYMPVEGRFKVFMIDEVHMLTNTAFNAMLKTLEEPPDYLKFVLATTDPQKIPVTVLSRCLQFNLRPMVPEVVREHLAHVLRQENIAADPQALWLLARAARGSMRDALSLTDQAIAFGSGKIEEEAVRHMLGSADRVVVMRLLEALVAGDGASIVEQVDHMRGAGLNPASTLEDMAAVLQRMAVLQAVPAGDADDADPDAAAVARLAQDAPPDETQLLYSLCLHGRAELGLAPDEYAGLTMVLLRFLPFRRPSGPRQPAAAEPPPAAAEKKTLKSAEEAPSARAPQSPQPTVATPAARLPESVALQPAPAPVSTPEPPAPAPAPAAWANEDPGPQPEDDLPWADDDDMAAPTTALAGRGGGRMPAAAAQPLAQALPVRGYGAPPEGDDAQTPTAHNALDARASNADADAGAPPDWVAVQVREDAPTRPETPAPGSGAPPEIVPSTHGDFWHDLVRGMVAREAVTALVRELALQSQLALREEGEWTLQVANGTLANPGSIEKLQAALAQAGYAVRLKIVTGPVTDSPSRRNAIAAANRLKAAESMLLSDPFVQEMMQDFGATIVPGSIRPL
ncbi:MAG: DNA polymerase III subunit gamma/tau [Burkholderiaceae bacterium]|jgi:DNA polymerase-3 subunit gamma/tau|nr:DNA polymerase III subunit gamma/tau [Burkholderiaceae bacterium]